MLAAVSFVLLVVALCGQVGAVGDRSSPSLPPSAYEFYCDSDGSVFIAEEKPNSTRARSQSSSLRRRIHHPNKHAFFPNEEGANLIKLWKEGIEELTKGRGPETLYSSGTTTYFYEPLRVSPVGRAVVMKVFSVNYYKNRNLLYVRLRNEQFGIQEDFTFARAKGCGVPKAVLLALVSSVVDGRHMSTVNAEG
eukprot:Lankesteria_metandrocarpae@DN11013_c0_g1_i1.p1